MTNEEKFLMEKVGRKNPFKVPDGYFETFAEQLMKQLPEHKASVIEIQKPKDKTKRPLWFVAASVAAILLSSLVYISLPSSRSDASVSSAALQAMNTASQDSYVDQAADYAMVDNSDIYAYLMSE